MDIRKATIADIPQLVELRLALLKEANEIKEDITALKVSIENYFTKNIPTDNFISYIAVCKKMILACSGLIFYEVPPFPADITGKVAYIMNMYTRPNYRGYGIATKLFDEIMREAKEQGYIKITLNATDMGKSIYKKFGFKEVGGNMVLYTNEIT